MSADDATAGWFRVEELDRARATYDIAAASARRAKQEAAMPGATAYDLAAAGRAARRADEAWEALWTITHPKAARVEADEAGR